MRRRQFARHQRIVPTFAQIEERHAAEQPALLGEDQDAFVVVEMVPQQPLFPD
jgi:hypothetical protein